MACSDQLLPSEVDMSRWADRAAGLEEVDLALDGATSMKPIAIVVSAQDIGRMYHEKYSPKAFMQELLSRFKFAGAPVEGVINMKLAHGAVARVKSNPLEPQDFFQYIWLPEPYVRAIAAGGGNGLMA